jgi:hypothetical protein
MKKKISCIFMLVLAFASCKQQADYKETRDEVIKVHDVVMAYHGRVVDQQLKLGEMLKNMSAVKANNLQLDTLKEKDSITVVRDRLNVAEEAMKL